MSANLCSIIYVVKYYSSPAVSLSYIHCESKKTVPFCSCQMWINFNDSFSVVTIKFLYTNVELNLPHHLYYVAALPCKLTPVHRACETASQKIVPYTFAATLAIAIRF